MKEKLKKLTHEQKSKFPYYREKWINIGLDTSKFSLEEATDIIHDFQEKILKRKKTPIIIANNPLEAWKIVIKEKLKERTIKRGEVESEVWNEVRSEVWNEVWNEVGNEVENEGKINFVHPYQDGSFFASIFSYYNFFIDEGLVNLSEDLKEKFDIWQKTSKLGLIYPLKEVCVVCRKPTKINKNSKGLHCETGMALEYEGWGFHALNGMRVPKYLAETPAENLDLEFFKKEKNADIRSEFVRKYGIERMLDFGSKLDTFENYNEEWWTKSEYELWDMSNIFDGLDYQPYLKMLNQTSRIWHVEAVSPKCRTLREAIKERFDGRDFTIKAIA